MRPKPLFAPLFTRPSADKSAQIARDFPGYAELAAATPLSISQTQALLKPDEALVSFLSLEKQSYVYAVTREDSLWQEIPLGDVEISERVNKLRAGLFNEKLPSGSQPEPFNLGAAHELYAALLGPIESFVSKKPKMLVIPTGVSI